MLIQVCLEEQSSSRQHKKGVIVKLFGLHFVAYMITVDRERILYFFILELAMCIL
jgi:hypothetical protein